MDLDRLGFSSDDLAHMHKTPKCGGKWIDISTLSGGVMYRCSDCGAQIGTAVAAPSVPETDVQQSVVGLMTESAWAFIGKVSAGLIVGALVAVLVWRLA